MTNSPPVHESKVKILQHIRLQEKYIKLKKRIRRYSNDSANAKAHTGVRIPELRGLSMRKAMHALNNKELFLI